ncbi:MAG: outer membrane lipoprotein-sorting protein [Polyangiaceae bacterium]|jgi:outer membrane lipoprotein-sorting protein|nr:outer membrane lipoprotein-sorting protein [Polyangiaceae bacterium]MBK8937373.1 outer membrane lipoprotein-sorting protein [Polyangiaceae bacterium]
MKGDALSHLAARRQVLKATAAGFGLWATSGLLIARDAQADEKGDKVLAAVDAAVFKSKTQVIEYDGTIKTPDKPDRKLSLRVMMKGDKRFSEFLAPSDVKGTKVLILSPSQMYVYLPAFKKVRRIASHVTDQGFMGMNFTQDEMSITSYGKMYSATVASDDGKVVKLVMTAKKDSEAPYPKVEMWLEKARNLPTEVKYYSDTGAHLKTETRLNYTVEKECATPSELKMVDHTKNNMSTTLVRKALQINTDIPDSRFTKRALEEGT